MDIAELLVLPGFIDTVKIKPLFLFMILFQYSTVLNIPCKFQLIAELEGKAIAIMKVEVLVLAKSCPQSGEGVLGCTARYRRLELDISDL